MNYFVCLIFVIFHCYGVYVKYDPEKGSELGNLSIGNVSCPVWAVSHNTINLDCDLNIIGWNFFIDNITLTPNNTKGGIILTSLQTFEIPYNTSYLLNVTEGNKTLGSLVVPANTLVPKSLVISKLPNLDDQYKVGSDNITIVNANTFFIPRFKYNGKGPDAYFWVGKGDKPNENGQIVPNELGNKTVLGRYESKDVLIHLPGSLTMHDIDYLSVWCKEFKHDFGHVKIPPNITIPPASYAPQVMSSSSEAPTQKTKEKNGTGNGQEGVVAVWLILFITAVVALMIQ